MSARPRVVHVYKDYWPPVVGGIERCINWMAHGTCDRFDVTVLVNSRSTQSRERFDGPVRVLEIAELGRMLSAPISPAMTSAIRELKADIWHFHIPNPTGDVAWRIAKPAGKVVATYHSDVVRQVVARMFYAPMLRGFLKRCDAIMPTSPRLVDASPFLSRERDRCIPVPLGMPQARFQRTGGKADAARAIRQKFQGRPMLIFVGKLRYYKGLQFAIAAMQQVRVASFLIIGDGPERAKLENLAKELGVAERVHFLGELPDPQVVEHMMAADMFVLPSHLPSEAYGLSQIEAMACGLPVICCDLATGVPWVNRDGVTGVVVPPADPDALANAIQGLLADSPKRYRMGEAALRRAQSEFTDTTMNARLMDVYKSVLGRASTPIRAAAGR